MDCTHQAPLCMGFSRQEYWSGLPCPHPGDLPDLGMEPCRSREGSPIQCPLIDKDVYSAVLGWSFLEVSVRSGCLEHPAVWMLPHHSSLYRASLCPTSSGCVESPLDGCAFVSVPTVLSGFASRLLKRYTSYINFQDFYVLLISASLCQLKTTQCVPGSQSQGRTFHVFSVLSLTWLLALTCANRNRAWPCAVNSMISIALSGDALVLLGSSSRACSGLNSVEGSRGASADSSPFSAGIPLCKCQPPHLLGPWPSPLNPGRPCPAPRSPSWCGSLRCLSGQ